jgi:hypothetical protein
VIPTKQGNANATSVDQTFNMFGVLLNFLVTPNETGHEISLFKSSEANQWPLNLGRVVVWFQFFWEFLLVDANLLDARVGYQAYLRRKASHRC